MANLGTQPNMTCYAATIFLPSALRFDGVKHIFANASPSLFEDYPSHLKHVRSTQSKELKFEFLLYLFHYSKTDVELLLKYDCCETILILYHTCILLQAVVKQTIARFKHASSIEKGMLYSVYQSLPNNMLLSSPLLLILQ